MSVNRPILGESSAVRSLISMISKVAGNKTNVLIIGESGTGKELVARMIHETGPLKGKPFVPVNCGAIPETLIESEMFGHKKGSFTGAVGDKAGLFEAANGGTLFLDEVGELPLSMQVKLLRSLQEKVVRRVGSNSDVKVDVRIIAATNRDLEAAVAAGTFREDLYYRLNVILIKTPPLRERHGDIELLAQSFLKKFSDRQGKALTGFSAEAMAAIMAHHWPGNVRELENVVERAVTLEPSDQIELASMPSTVVDSYARAPRRAGGAMPGVATAGAGTGAMGLAVPAGASYVANGAGDIRVPQPDFSKGPMNLDEILGDIERQYLLKALEHTGGVKKKAAEMLGMTFRSIRYRLAKLGLDQDGEDES